MGRAYALVTGLCYSGDGFEERGQRLFAEVLERLHDDLLSRQRQARRDRQQGQLSASADA